MKIRIEDLSTKTERVYDDWLKTVPNSLLYHSLAYRDFLRQILKGADEHYLLAFADDELTAAIPCFSCEGVQGTIINSLPFFGSNGSVVANPGCPTEVIHSLMGSFDEKCRSLDSTSSTIITNPLDKDLNLALSNQTSFQDHRIGQITKLPDVSAEESGSKLMKSFHVKTRNLVRKGQKAGFAVAQENNKVAMYELYLIHSANMSSIGGRSKPWGIFEAILDNFDAGTGYALYTARQDGELAAALLILFGNETVEYFTPVIDQNYRSDQPLSLLIFEAMKDAVSMGYSNWNWGGTWHSQKGVYHFKSRWGTNDLPYTYNVSVYKNLSQLKNCSSKELLQNYPYFYVIPFSEVQQND
jgi:hypothetical protein